MISTIQKGWGKYCVAPWNRKSCNRGEVKLEKKTMGNGYFLDPQCDDGSIILI